MTIADRMPRILRTRAVAVLGSLVLYGVLAVATTWPAARYAHSLMPAGSTRVATVPLFNVWTIWWNADRCRHGFQNYWNAPIFWPHGGTFAFSEPQPATLLVAPVIWLTDSRVLAYNIYLLASLVANGVFAAWCLRTLQVSQGMAIAGGAAVMLLPIVHEQIDVVQLVPLWTVLWGLGAIIRVGRRPTVPRGISVGCAIGLTFWTSVHHGLFLSLVLLATCPALPIQWSNRHTWLATGAATLAAAAFSLPVVLPMHAIMADFDFERSERMVRRLSVHPGEFLTAPGSGLLPGGLVSEPGARRRLPGWLNCGLAAMAVIAGLRGRRRRVVWYLTSIVIVSAVLSLGTNLQLGSWTPWWTLSDVVPGLAQVRNVFRFVYLFQLAILLLAFRGLWLVACWFRIRRRWSRRTVVTCVVILAVLATAELFPRRGPTAGAPDINRNLGWVSFVSGSLQPGKAVLHLPYVPGHRVADFDETLRMMYLATWHGRPLVNGYSGFFPKSHFELQRLLTNEFPTTEALQQLAISGVDLVVVLRSQFPQHAMLQPVSAAHRLELSYSDDHGRDVYRLISASLRVREVP